MPVDALGATINGTDDYVVSGRVVDASADPVVIDTGRSILRVPADQVVRRVDLATDAELAALESRVTTEETLFFDDFVDYTTNRWSKLTSVGASANSYLQQTTFWDDLFAGCLGVVRISAGSTTTGLATMRLGPSYTTNQILTAGSFAEVKAKVYLGTSSGGIARIGWAVLTAGEVEPSSGPYAYLELDANLGKATAYAGDGSSSDADGSAWTPSAYAGVAMSTYRIEVNESGDFVVSINGTPYGTVASTYVPVDDKDLAVAFFISLENSASLVWTSIDSDWVRLGRVYY